MPSLSSTSSSSSLLDAPVAVPGPELVDRPEAITVPGTFSDDSTEFSACGPEKVGRSSHGITRHQRNARFARSCKRLLARLPAGGLAAGLTVILVHLVVGAFVYPHPVARKDLRAAVQQLTRAGRPALIFAGDSRVATSIMPIPIADVFRLPHTKVVNLGVGFGSSCSVWTAYREFASRFESSPILVLGTSIADVNDHGSEETVSEEILWSLGLRQRLQLVSARRALTAIFLPERSLLAGTSPPTEVHLTPIAEQGYLSFPPAENFYALKPDRQQRHSSSYQTHWYHEAKLDGLRWGRFQADLQRFVDAGVQLVFLVVPCHPSFPGYAPDAPEGQAEARYRAQLAEQCGQMNIPLLIHNPDCFAGRDVNLLFRDMVHTNRLGAAAFSEIVARDLDGLIQQGRLRLPSH